MGVICVFYWGSRRIGAMATVRHGRWPILCSRVLQHRWRVIRAISSQTHSFIFRLVLLFLSSPYPRVDTESDNFCSFGNLSCKFYVYFFSPVFLFCFELYAWFSILVIAESLSCWLVHGAFSCSSSTCWFWSPRSCKGCELYGVNNSEYIGKFTEPNYIWIKLSIETATKSIGNSQLAGVA